jgi:hypothetical protein
LVVLNGILKIFHLSQLLKTGGNGDGEVIEKCGATWTAERAKDESLSEVPDGSLQVIHPSQLLKSCDKCNRQLV